MHGAILQSPLRLHGVVISLTWGQLYPYFYAYCFKLHDVTSEFRTMKHFENF